MSEQHQPVVAIVVGSASDCGTMESCLDALKRLRVSFEARVLSAHRTPNELVEYVSTLQARGVKVVVAGAGMAAHLAGVVAAHTTLPVIGVPMDAGPLRGVDALLSTAQMPGGVPVATMAIGAAGAKNAAYFAARLLALSDPALSQRLAVALQEDRQRVLDARFAGAE